MIAYKGLKKDLTCLGYQFLLNQVNITDQANCAENGFHCAENPLDCLCYYRDWRKSVYFLVKAEGDLDEDSVDSKISCTRITLLKELSFQMLLLHGLAYMARHPGRKWCSIVKKEEGRCWDGYVVVRGKHPKASAEFFVVSSSGNSPWLIMVCPVETVPGLVIHCHLPFAENCL